MEEVEKGMIMKVLEECEGNVTEGRPTSLDSAAKGCS